MVAILNFIVTELTHVIVAKLCSEVTKLSFVVAKIAYCRCWHDFIHLKFSLAVVILKKFRLINDHIPFNLKGRVGILPSHQMLSFLASIYLNPGFKSLIFQRWAWRFYTFGSRFCWLNLKGFPSPIPFSYFTFPSAPYRIFLLFLPWLPFSFTLLSSQQQEGMRKFS